MSITRVTDKQVTYKQGATGTVVRNLGDKLRESVSVLDFGAVSATTANIAAGTGTDNQPMFALAIAAALALASTGIPIVHVPAGIYGMGSRLEIPSGVKLTGDGSYGTIIYPLAAFGIDANGILNTVESGSGQPPGGIFDLAVNGNVTLPSTTPGIVLGANASSCERVWVGAFAGTHLVCKSTNQIVSRVVIDNAIPGAASVGIEVRLPGVQIDTCTIYQQQTGIYIHDLPTNVGKVPVQVSNVTINNPLTGSGYGVLVHTTNGMPVFLNEIVLQSDLTTGYLEGGFRLLAATNTHLSDCRVEYPAAATLNQVGFYVDTGSNDTTLDNCSTKHCSIGMTINATSVQVSGGVHTLPGTFGVQLFFGTDSTVEGVMSIAANVGFRQENGGVRNSFQNCTAVGGNTGFSVNSTSGVNRLKGNHTTAGTAYTLTTPAKILMEGNTDTNGFFYSPRATVTVTAGTHTLDIAEENLIVDFAGTCSVTLPTASANNGRKVLLKTVTANLVVSASANVVPKVGGTAVVDILPATDGAWATLVSNGTAWEILQSGV
jgi:hypothetical protein